MSASYTAEGSTCIECIQSKKKRTLNSCKQVHLNSAYPLFCKLWVTTPMVSRNLSEQLFRHLCSLESNELPLVPAHFLKHISLMVPAIVSTSLALTLFLICTVNRGRQLVREGENYLKGHSNLIQIRLLLLGSQVIWIHDFLKI